MGVQIIHGDALEVMRGMAEASVDAVVTDPPAGINFMSRAWDGDKGGRDQWIAWMQAIAAECLRVCKPGSHSLVWALPRTSHWTATAWENAGWEVRDRVSHLFGSGYPKSHSISKAFDKKAGAEREVTGYRMPPADWDGWKKGFDAADCERQAGASTGGYGGGIKSGLFAPITEPSTDLAKQWDGWGTALKPAMEDWWLLRKPLIGTVAQNVAKHGTGALNIDGCRVGYEPGGNAASNPAERQRRGCNQHHGRGIWRDPGEGLDIAPSQLGRWPANLVHDGSDEVLEAFARFGSDKGAAAPIMGTEPSVPAKGDVAYGFRRRVAAQHHGDTGTAARFFKACPWEPGELRFHYTAKAGREERDIGHQGLPLLERAATWGDIGAVEGNPRKPATSHVQRIGNHHPTVKPLSLMQWLCRLITPPGGTVLDMFAGSGSTLIAADREQFNAIGIERELEYVTIMRRRVHGDAPLLMELSA